MNFKSHSIITTSQRYIIVRLTITDMHHITITTDGSGTHPPHPGGAAAILRSYIGHYHEVMDALPSATNNQMELLAILLGLSAIQWRGIVVLVRSDSRVALGWASGTFRRDRFAYATGMGAAVDEICRLQRLRVIWQHVPGHRGDVDNERAHDLANVARKAAIGEETTRVHTATGELEVIAKKKAIRI